VSAPPPIAVVGMVGGETFGRAARQALAGAEVVVAAPRHLDSFDPFEGQDVVPLQGELPPLLEAIAGWRASGRRVCVVASGDPGFFGIVRTLAARVGAEHLAVHPAPSSVALAFAAVGVPWEDALVVSAHGRALEPAITAALHEPKVAILTSPANSPAVVGAALVAAGRRGAVVVASRLGEADQRVERIDVTGLATTTFDPMSVVLLLDGEPEAPTITWGRDEHLFSHRGGMITKPEVRAVALAKLDLPRQGVLWDVGAGSGSVGIEAALLAPRLRVVALERDAEDASHIRANAAAHGASVELVVGQAPDAFVDLPTPDRVFVGGGGPAVVAAAWERLAPGGVLVATSVVLEHAVEHRRLLGDLLQVRVDVAVPIGRSGVRFEPRNPVFVSWGRR
jgi:precorrin-6Y C5,15-methyltransferase (decarboxylating)